jgi:hypothetical protein
LQRKYIGPVKKVHRYQKYVSTEELYVTIIKAFSTNRKITQFSHLCSCGTYGGEIHTGFWQKNVKEKNSLENLLVEETIILKLK